MRRRPGRWPSGRPGRRSRHRRRGRHVQRDASDRGRAEPPANTAKVEQGKLSVMVSLDGTLTYRARSDGSPYAVINQARGTYTELPDGGDKIGCGGVLYRVDDGPCCCCAARSRVPRPARGNAATMSAAQPEPAPPRVRRRRVDPAGDFTARRRRRSTAPARQGSTDRSARSRRRGLPARAGADRQGDRRARGSARPGAQVCRDLRHARGAAGPRGVPAGRGQDGRPRPDHAARQHVGDGEGGPARRVARCAGQDGGAGGATIPAYISLDDPSGARARQGPGPGRDHDQGVDTP